MEKKSVDIIIREALEVLRSGGIIIYPTDTKCGIGFYYDETYHYMVVCHILCDLRNIRNLVLRASIHSWRDGVISPTSLRR